MIEKKILIVDDDEVARQYCKSILKKNFPLLVVAEAQDFEEAQEKVYDFKPDLIFLDVRLPDKSGFELARKIKAENLDIFVVIITGYDIPEYRKEAQKLGCKAFIYKGFESAVGIVHAVKNCLPASG